MRRLTPTGLVRITVLAVASAAVAGMTALPAAAAPAAPVVRSVAAAGAGVSVAFVPPPGTGIVNYQASFSRAGGTWSSWRGARPADVTSPVAYGGLVAGAAYRVRIRALTAAGPGAASAPSSSFRPPPVPTTTTKPVPPTTRPAPTTTTVAPPPTTVAPAPGGTEIVVAPNGNDAAGGTASAPLRTLAEAWARIPSGVPLTAPVTITLRAGTYAEATLPNYLEHRLGTAAAPITIRSDGPGRPVTLLGDLNVFDVHHFTLTGVRIAPGGDAFHCEQCTFVTLADVELDGTGGAWDLLKVNQSANVTVRDSFVHGAGDNAIDLVAVQHAALAGNRIADAQDWCAYAKGGSTDVLVEGNEISGCGTGGFTAGQGTGLEWMVAPWLTYEASHVIVRGNHVHDVDGAAFGVNGGLDVLIEGNRAERVGRRSHLIEVTFGARSCDGDATRCRALLAQGAWGTAVTGGDVYANVPDRDVVIRDNVIVNPPGYRSAWQHFEISTPRVDPAGAVGPSPARTDDGLVIAGNTIVNGDASMPLGIDDSVVCTPSNPTCTVAQIWRDNDVNGR